MFTLLGKRENKRLFLTRDFNSSLQEQSKGQTTNCKNNYSIVHSRVWPCSPRGEKEFSQSHSRVLLNKWIILSEKYKEFIQHLYLVIDMHYIILVNAVILFSWGGQRKFFLQLITEFIYIPKVQEWRKKVKIKDSSIFVSIFSHNFFFWLWPWYPAISH